MGTTTATTTTSTTTTTTNFATTTATTAITSSTSSTALTTSVTMSVATSTGTTPPACHTPTPGEECYENVIWVMEEGIYLHPNWYPGLTASSSFDDIQKNLFQFGHGNCQRPCATNLVPACHTAIPGEECYTNVELV